MLFKDNHGFFFSYLKFSLLLINKIRTSLCSHNGQDNDHHFKEATEWLGLMMNLAIELFTNHSKNYNHFIYSLSLFAKKFSKLKVVKNAAFQVTCATKKMFYILL